MITSNNEALGILFPNSYDNLVPELVSERLMASIPFAGRYRLVDFILSSMAASGIDNVSLIVKKNYHSLMDHLGSGREWDLTRKNGGLNIVPPFAQKTVSVYSGRVQALASILPFLKGQKEKYVILSDTNLAINFDFRELLNTHIKSNADVTIAYCKSEITKDVIEKTALSGDLYYTFDLKGTRIKGVQINPQNAGTHNLSMNIYVLSRELLIQQISDAYVKGLTYFERDLLMPQLETLNVQGFQYKGYLARITSTKSYFDENMRLLDEKNLNALFSPNPIYTKIRDDNPTRYIGKPKVTNSMMADGCVIEGEVENSILFRGVKVEKGAKVKNCILMQDTVIEAGARVENVISDKNVKVTVGQEVRGTDSFPVYIEKGRNV